MPTGVVVDTTVWIDFFRGRNEPVCQHLRQLIRYEDAVLVGIVMAEVLQGIRSSSERRQVEEHFAALPYLEASWNSWRSSADLARALRSEGRTIPLSDLLLAAMAIEHNLSVYSTDSHFNHIPGLELYRAS